MYENEQYMLRALELARKGRFSVSPNPMVGCVIVKDDIIVGEGFHVRAGEAHAEIHALQQAGLQAEDATVYLTLEPCCHFGRTPPCTNALINTKVKKVFVACLDPNPLVAGKGVEALRNAGIEVEVGLFEKEAKQLNEIFFHYITKRLPYVILKWAMSLDGKTTTHVNDSRQISSSETQYHAHELRQQVDAILIGAGTALHDDPALTVRYHQNEQVKHPIRIVLTRDTQLPHHLKIFDVAMPSQTILIGTKQAQQAWYQSILSDKIEFLIAPANAKGHVDLKNLLTILGARGITSLLVEGGMTVLQSFFQENLANKIHVYLADVIIGDLEKKQTVFNVAIEKLGSNFHLSGYSEEQKDV